MGMPMSKVEYRLTKDDLLQLYLYRSTHLGLNQRLSRGYYFRSVLRKEYRRLSWSWIIFGNISSNAILVAIALTVRTLQEAYP